MNLVFNISGLDLLQLNDYSDDAFHKFSSLLRKSFSSLSQILIPGYPFPLLGVSLVSDRTMNYFHVTQVPSGQQASNVTRWPVWSSFKTESIVSTCRCTFTKLRRSLNKLLRKNVCYSWSQNSFLFLFSLFARNLSSNDLRAVTKETFQGLKSIEYL